MPDITVENLFNQIVQLPQPEQFKLWRMLEPLVKAKPAENGTPEPAIAENGTPKPDPPKKKLQPKPMPNKDREMQWLVDHAREYAGQWVALGRAS